MVTFLGVNGYDFTATEADVVGQFLALADRRVTEASLADWIRKHSAKSQ